MAGVQAISVYPQKFVTCIVNSERQDLTHPFEKLHHRQFNSNYHAIQKISKHRHVSKSQQMLPPGTKTNYINCRLHL